MGVGSSSMRREKVCEQIFSFLLGRTLDQNTPPELEELVDLTRPRNFI